jgi:hypothetical protein
MKSTTPAEEPDANTTDGVVASASMTLPGQDNLGVSYLPESTPESSTAPDDPPVRRMVRVFSLGREQPIETKCDDEIEDIILIFNTDSAKKIQLINWRTANEDCEFMESPNYH